MANRISTICSATDVPQWRYVHTTQNPADEASRGLTIGHFLINQRWIEGPEFLWKTEEVCPVRILDSEIAVDDPKVKRELIANAVIVKDTPNATKQPITYCSDLRRLKRSVACILKIRKALNEMSRKRQQLSQKDADINGTLKLHLKDCLTPEYFAEAEISIISLSSGKCGVQKESTIYKLDPNLEAGVLGGRLSKAAMSEETKHPVILSKDQHVSSLILKNIH